MLKPQNRLRRDSDFKAVFNRGMKKYNRNFSLYYLPTKRGKKVGIIVSKKHGNAVKRNLLKRRIRAIMYPLVPQLKYGNLILVPKVNADELDFKDLKKNIIHILNLGDLLKWDGLHSELFGFIKSLYPNIFSRAAIVALPPLVVNTPDRRSQNTDLWRLYT